MIHSRLLARLPIQSAHVQRYRIIRAPRIIQGEATLLLPQGIGIDTVQSQPPILSTASAGSVAPGMGVSITLGSAAGIGPGTTLVLDPGTSAQELVTVTTPPSANTVTVSFVVNSHAAGFGVITPPIDILFAPWRN